MMEKRKPWEYQPAKYAHPGNAALRREKYRYCINQGLSEEQASRARDWDWPRIHRYIRQMGPLKLPNNR
jgi:hypothetical protein